LVACCYRCNNSKGDRTPEEAGLKLARRPRPFTLHTSRQLMRLIGHRTSGGVSICFINEFPRMVFSYAEILENFGQRETFLVGGIK